MKQRQDNDLGQKAKVVLFVVEERRIHKRMGSTKLYGILKLKLISAGVKCGRDKFIDIMREEGLLVKKKKNYTRTTDSNHRYHKYPNLIQDLEITKPEQVYVLDITYIRVADGFMYLFLCTDAYSKQIMGYYLSEDMKVSSAKKTLQMAISNSKCATGIIHHSDRGLQYCHPDYTDFSELEGMVMSMTTKHDPYENAVAERVNGILKNEYGIGDGYPDANTARRDITRVIWIYNNLRPHMSCHMLTPVQAHEQSYYKLRRWGRTGITANKCLFPAQPSPMAFRAGLGGLEKALNGNTLDNKKDTIL
jgi:putative transposase